MGDGYVRLLLRNLITIAVGLFELQTCAAASDQCSWKSGLDKVGIACEGWMEFTEMVLSCEQSPLYLWVSTDCDGERTCDAALEIDDREFSLGRADFSDDGYSGVSVSIADKIWLLKSMAKAHQLRTIIAGKKSRALPTNGLRQAITAITAACLQQPSFGETTPGR
jgi:hypothetical protein